MAVPMVEALAVRRRLLPQRPAPRTRAGAAVAAVPAVVGTAVVVLGRAVVQAVVMVTVTVTVERGILAAVLEVEEVLTGHQVLQGVEHQRRHRSVLGKVQAPPNLVH